MAAEEHLESVKLKAFAALPRGSLTTISLSLNSLV